MLWLQRAFPEVPVITRVQERECHPSTYCVQVATGDTFQSFDIIRVNWRKCGAVLAQGGSQSGPHLGREHVYGTHLLLSSLASMGRSHIWIPLPLWKVQASCLLQSPALISQPAWRSRRQVNTSCSICNQHALDINKLGQLHYHYHYRHYCWTQSRRH